MMLPTDIALKEDPEFAVWAQKFADDEGEFFASFAKNYGKLMALGCPEKCQPVGAPVSDKSQFANFKCSKKLWCVTFSVVSTE